MNQSNSHLNQTFIEEMKQKLLEEKKRLEEDLAGLHSHTEMGDDTEANSDEVGQDEVSQDIMATIKADIAKIDLALEKIASGTYGIDDEGKEISQERLRALPWADKAI
jgi:RNA polymerase-binding transcription factor DksA